MITTGFRTIEGSGSIGENALAKFRSRKHSIDMDDRFLLPEEKKGYGYETGDRFLPYKWQDLFTRERTQMRIRTIIMENDHVRAEFWPDYGMRLYSLIQKDDGRQLLFDNPVLQIGNLAVRKAWFSGGIEWNFGQYGHTVTTCSPLFVAKMKGKDGEEFLRAYEYERMRGLFWHMDFHLAADDRYLWVYSRFVNPVKEKVPFYWWTNIAVREGKKLRVYSGTDDVIFINSVSMEKEGAAKVMCHGRLPYLGIKPGYDYTYPESFTDYASEYFFQNRHREDETWEAAAWNDGWVFFDRADRNLAYHKMFCWGEEQGGQHWRDYLSRDGEGGYIELQAGFSPTQVHGMDIEGSSSLDFVQMFGGFKTSLLLTECDYDEGRRELYSEMNSLVSEEEVRKRKAEYASLSALEPAELLHYGSGYGALEALRDSSLIPPGFIFPYDSIGEEEKVWEDVLKGKSLPEEEIPSSYMTDMRWKDAIAAVAGGNFNAWNILAVMYLENEMDAEAEECFKKALSLRRNAFSLRCLALMSARQGRTDDAVSLMRECVALDKRREYSEEYVDLLVSLGRWKDAWDFYETLDESIRDDEALIMGLLPAACQLVKKDFLEKCFKREFALIREGGRVYTESWFWLQAMRFAEKKGIEFSEDLVRQFEQKNEIPKQFDFRMG